MRLPDGSTQPLASLHVRATEYTVGADGIDAMPATLPPESDWWILNVPNKYRQAFTDWKSGCACK